MNIVAVGAHQDDVEIHCLGTLLRCRARGDAVTTVTVSNGDKGCTEGTTSATLTKRRNEEASAIAEELGGEHVCLFVSDEFVLDSEELRLELAAVVRRVAADVVLAPPPVDYNRDHIVVSEVVSHAALLAAIPAVDTDHRALTRAPTVYYMDAVAGLEWQPTLYVDITTEFERKLGLLRLYESQMTHMERWGGCDLVSYAEIVDRFRGLQCGVSFAEGFKPEMTWQRLRPGSLLP